MGCQGQDKGAGEVRLRCLCFSWGVDSPIQSPPPTQARKRSARTPAGLDTPHLHNKQMPVGPRLHRQAGVAESVGGLQVRFQGLSGWPLPTSGNLCLWKQWAIRLGEGTRLEEGMRGGKDKGQRQKCQMTPSMGGREFKKKKKNPPVHMYNSKKPKTTRTGRG